MSACNSYGDQTVWISRVFSKNHRYDVAIPNVPKGRKLLITIWTPFYFEQTTFIRIDNTLTHTPTRMHVIWRGACVHGYWCIYVCMCVWEKKRESMDLCVCVCVWKQHTLQHTATHTATHVEGCITFAGFFPRLSLIRGSSANTLQYRPFMAHLRTQAIHGWSANTGLQHTACDLTHLYETWIICIWLLQVSFREWAFLMADLRIQAYRIRHVTSLIDVWHDSFECDFCRSLSANEPCSWLICELWPTGDAIKWVDTVTHCNTLQHTLLHLLHDFFVCHLFCEKRPAG